MSNNQNAKIKKLEDKFKDIFQNGKSRIITPTERVEFVRLLRDSDIDITNKDFLYINAMLKTMLEKKVDNTQITDFEKIIKKLKGNLTIQFVPNPKFLISPSTQDDLEAIIMSKSYTSSTLLGEGGYGKVFLLNVSGQQFVLKKIKLQDEESRILVQDEIKALKDLIGEWYAVQILADAILKDRNCDIAYILYPYIPGETLDTYQTLPHPEEEEYKIYSDIIEGVELLHKKNILHSDIKPENIWIPTNRNIRPFLLDFGLIQSLNTGTIAKKSGTRRYWSTKRRSRPMTNQLITSGINWIALAKTLGSRLTNNNSHPLSPLRNGFNKLYHAKNENSIRKNNINRTRITVRAPRTMNPSSISRSVHLPNQINNNNNNRNIKKRKK